MNGLSKFILLFTTLFSTFGGPFSAYAADSINLLVMIDDADKNAIARDSQISKRVHASISQQLNHIADIYDETSITLDTSKQGRIRRSDAELLDIARSISRPPIDIVLVFSTYVSMQTSDYAKKAQARVEARLLNAKSGKFLDNFEVQSPKGWAIPYACKQHTCMLQEIGNEAKVLGDELGLVLAQKLDWLMKGDNNQSSDQITTVDTSSASAMINDYYLEFDGFNPQDMASIEEYLLVFSGYVSHRPSQQRHTRSTLLYRSTSGTAKLNRNIVKVLEELNMRATINFQGDEFKLKRITLRGEKSPRDISEGW